MVEQLDLAELGLSEKEEKITLAAIKIFAEKGFDKATTREIAQTAGIAEGTIFRYFKTKKAILSAIMANFLKIFGEKLVLSSLEKVFTEGRSQDLKLILKNIFYDRLKLVDRIFPMARVVLTNALFHEDLRNLVYETVMQRAWQMFHGFFTDLKKRGLIRNGIEPEIMLRTILGNIFLYIGQRKLFSEQIPLKNLEDDLDKIIDVVLYGFANPQPSANKEA